MIIIQAIILGIIEGLTEFLPISSTGHLLVAEKVVGYHDAARLFTVVIQVGAIAAVIWHYRKDIIAKVVGLFKRDNNILKFWWVLIIGTIPAGLLGVIADKLLGNNDLVGVVASALIIGGVIMLYAENHFAKSLAMPKGDINDITPKQALIVGAAQVASLIPGMSRSGATIVGGMFAGLNRVTATAFSFYLSMPILILASGYKLVKNGSDIANISGGSTGLIVGTLVSFVTALFAIRWLLQYVAQHNFKPFAYYRIILGALLLVLLGVGYL